MTQVISLSERRTKTIKKDVPVIQSLAPNPMSDSIIQNYTPIPVNPLPWPVHSPSIGKLADALAKAQSEIKKAVKDKRNEYFKASYADLEAVWDAMREPLSKYGLSISQPFNMTATGDLVIITLLMHSSGEWIQSVTPVITNKKDPQGYGSAITYFRRFASQSIVFLTVGDKEDKDDDGNAANGNEVKSVPSEIKVKKLALDLVNEAQLAELEELTKTLGVLKKDVRDYAWQEFGKEIRALSQNEFLILVDVLKSGKLKMMK